MHYGSTRSEAGHLLNPDADRRQRRATVFVEAVAKTADNRLPLIALAYAAAAAEANMRSRQATWQFDPELAVRWLTILEDLGYPLSEVGVAAADLLVHPAGGRGRPPRRQPARRRHARPDEDEADAESD